MGIYLVLFGYVAVAVWTAGYVFHHGVVAWRRRPVVFGPSEMAKLWLACLMVGATWVLFVPVLTAMAARDMSGRFDIDPRAWMARWPRPAAR